MRVALHPSPNPLLTPVPPPPVDLPYSWRYEGGRRPPRVPVLALLVAASAHALGLFAFNQPAVVEVAHVEEEDTTILLVMPPLEDTEDIELVESDGPREEVEAASYVPMLADVPMAVIDTAFVQKIDYSSLAPRPDFDAAKVVTIPRGARTGGVQPESLKDIFNLRDLDRVPEPVFQPPPVFPRNLKNEVSKATVTVEFIVSPEGKVTWAKVTDATYPGFEDASIVGVMRWQFRPGMKNGKRVATRMIVPVVFRVVED